MQGEYQLEFIQRMWNTKQKGENMSGERFDNGYIKDSSSRTLGRLDGVYIKDSSSRTLGRVDGIYIKDSSSRTLGRIDGDYVKDSSSRTLGRVRDYTIRGMEREKDVTIVAAYHFLVKKIF